MKKLLAILLCIMICGCSKISGSLQSRLEQQIDAASEKPVAAANNRKTYFSYYLDPSIGKVSSDATSNVFTADGIEFAMSLDVAKIINEKYYPEQTVSHEQALKLDVIAETQGILTDRSGNDIPYEAKIYQYDENYVLLALSSGYVNFEAMCRENNAPAIAGRMIEISRSVNVSSQEVLAAYTTREGIDYAGTPVELFENKAPENGSIEELLVGYDGRKTEPDDEDVIDDRSENDE